MSESFDSAAKKLLINLLDKYRVALLLNINMSNIYVYNKKRTQSGP